MILFDDRLRLVLADRKPHAWTSALGISRSGTAHVFAGKAPRMETLTRIAEIERVRIDWLSGGQGAPFAVSACERAQDMQDAIEGGARQFLLLHDGVQLLLCAGTKVQKLFARRSDAGPVQLNYVAWRVLRCDGDMSGLLAPIRAMVVEGSDVDLRVHALTSEELGRTVRGEVGNWLLFGDFAGSNRLSYWSAATRVERIERFDALLGTLLRSAAGPARPYTYPLPGRPVPLMAAEGQSDLYELWARIPRERRELALRVLEAFTQP